MSIYFRLRTVGVADSIHVHGKRRKTKSSLTLLFLRRELKDNDEILNRSRINVRDMVQNDKYRFLALLEMTWWVGVRI